MGEKPHKGDIVDWFRYEVPDYGLGYLIRGRFVSHPDFAGLFGQTSYAVTHDVGTGEIETRNSRYRLVGPESEPRP